MFGDFTMFYNAVFIKPPEAFIKNFSEKNPCPIFYKEFNMPSDFSNAELLICALGIGYAYINGKKVGDDYFISPPSEYNKRLWVVRYDIKDYLKGGKNTFSVVLLTPCPHKYRHAQCQENHC